MSAAFDDPKLPGCAGPMGLAAPFDESPRAPDPDAVPVLPSRDYSRLRALARLWRRPDDPVGRALSEKLDRCRVVRPDAMPPDIAALGSRLILAAEGRDAESRALVMPEDSSPAGWTLPVSAPLGVALLGMAAGQWVETVERDGRRLAIRLIAVDQRSGLRSPG